jgi:RNA polymerase-binding transcription factor DksA
MRFDAETRARWRRHLMQRGLTLATILAELLAGKDKRAALDALGAPDRPGMRPEERARAALDQVEARRVLLDAGDDRFGRCDVCGADLGAAALGELPWADRCAAHASA